MIFESFELSPTPDEALRAQNALEWEFPRQCTEISIDIFQAESFQSNLAQFLEQASSEKLQCCVAHTTKASVPVIESRGTTNPALIFQNLMPMLEALGGYAETVKLRKRVRDDVNIEDAELPWRRSPFWLLLRVATHRQLQRQLGNEDGRAYYKMVVNMVLAGFLADCTHKISPELSFQVCDKLTRRLAKLQRDTEILQPATSILHDVLDRTTSFFKDTLSEASVRITRTCEVYRQGTIRRIERLPPRANKNDLYLKLPNSGDFLNSILNLRPQPQRGNMSTALPEFDVTMQQSTRFIKQYVDLTGFVAES